MNKSGGSHAVLVVGVLFLLCSLAFPAYLLYAITQAESYSKGVAAEIASRRTSEERERKERQLFISTEGARAYLESQVPTADTVPLLIEALERTGERLGVRVEVGSVDRVSAEGSIDGLILSARASGSFVQLFSLVQLFEQLPYATRIESVSLGRREAGGWELTIFIRSPLRKV